MAVTSHVYGKFIGSLAAKDVNLSSDSIKCMLLSAYTPAQGTHQFLADVIAAGTEASGTGYTAGGVALTSVTWTLSGETYTLNGTIPAWSTTGGSLAAAFAVFYDATPGTNATDPVICYWDLGGTQTSSNGSFTLTPNASGIVTATAS